MNIKLIALDLDGTTLNAHSKLSPGNRSALEYAISKGVHVVIASGRSFATLPEDVLSVPGIEYAITSNGAAVWHIPTRSCLRSSTLPTGTVETVLRLTGNEYHLTYECFINGAAYGDVEYVRNPARFSAVPQGLEYVSSTRTLLEDIRSFLLRHAGELESMDVVVPGEEMREKVTALLSPALPEVYITSSAPQLVELAHRDAGKHSGVRFLAEQLGLSPACVAAFGDADNDADMLRYAGVGVAVSNASPACLAAADLVTKHHHEDAVAYAIHELLNIG